MGYSTLSPNETNNPAEIAGSSGGMGTLFVKDVGKIDCALFDPSLGVIGQSWYVDVQLTGELDSCGFVLDFSQVKKLVRQVLHETLDHALILPVGCQTVQFSALEQGERWKLKNTSRQEGCDHLWEYACPKGAVFPIRTLSLKPVVVEQEFARLVKHRLPENVDGVMVKLRDEPISPTEASYRYTHGLEGHQGLCQRLFHGHRSRIEIYVGDERRADLEHYIAREVLGSSVHIATLSQIKSGNGEVGKRGTTDAPVTLSYRGSLGEYEATLPANRIFFVDQQTSIECLTLELARIVRQEEKPREKVRVVCFEGIDKGAVATL